MGYYQEEILREINSLSAEARRQRINELFSTADRLADLEMPPLTESEVEAEIEDARHS